MSKTKKNPADRYTLFVEWSDEDQCYIGRCPELFLGGVHGSDRAKVYAQLCAAVDENIALFTADGRQLPEAFAGKEFSGQFVVRLDPSLHRILAIRALGEGDSLNNFVKKKLAHAV